MESEYSPFGAGKILFQIRVVNRQFREAVCFAVVNTITSRDAIGITVMANGTHANSDVTITLILQLVLSL